MMSPVTLLLLSLLMQPPPPALPLPRFPAIPLFQFEFKADEPVDIKPTVQILHGNNPRSKLMVAELTRDWTVPWIPVPRDSLSPLARQMGKIQDGIRPHLVLVDVSRDPLFCYRTDLPLWRMREYGVPQKFDDRAFLTSSYPLLTVESIVFEATVDLNPWRRQCRQDEEAAKTEYFNEISAWVSQIDARGFARFIRDYGELHEENFQNLTSDDLVAEYGSWDGFPLFVWQPPPKPSKPFPWEHPCRYKSSPTTPSP